VGLFGFLQWCLGGFASGIDVPVMGGHVIGDQAFKNRSVVVIGNLYQADGVIDNEGSSDGSYKGRAVIIQWWWVNPPSQ
jgi:selenophosphate synthetase-related protein